MVMRSGLTDTWWVVLRYKALGDGRYEALDKHQLHPESVKILEAVLEISRNEFDRLCHGKRHTVVGSVGQRAGLRGFPVDRRLAFLGKPARN